MTNRGDFNRASFVMDVTRRSNFVATPIYHESPARRAPWCSVDNNTAHAFICINARKGIRRDRSGTIYIMPFRPLFYEVRLCAVCNSFRILIMRAAIQWRGAQREKN